MEISDRGIILAGGSGTRLYPATMSISKQLIPINGKPMIYYPLRFLMELGIREILIISTPQDTGRMADLLGSGHQWGINIYYSVQDSPRGIAEAFILGRPFIGDQPVTLLLGDNFFHNFPFEYYQKKFMGDKFNAFAFTKYIPKPQAFGVYDPVKNKLVEKPKIPPSNQALTGLYRFPSTVSHFAKGLKPSKRNELEIVDLINIYLGLKICNVEKLPTECFWKDCGTVENIALVEKYITMGKLDSNCVGSPEEAAIRLDYVSKKTMSAYITKQYSNVKNNYADFLRSL